VVATSHHDGIALVAPVAGVLAAADDLLADGRVRRPWLGVRAADATDDSTPGAVLTRISAGSPASAAGLQVGDRVVAVDEQPVADASDLVLALRSCDPGQAVVVEIDRAGVRLPVPVRLGG
jgi:S1-C subfamily serine protease